ncbi:hypothetical protein [Xenococcus sp. PCC 7305]|nr:hypothetical protein [Xenococcus sp. PCC 7305]
MSRCCPINHQLIMAIAIAPVRLVDGEATTTPQIRPDFQDIG